jgi:hypothetical protein
MTWACWAAPVRSEEARDLVVGQVTIRIQDIFSTEENNEARGLQRFLQRGMNALHIQTRDYVLRKELLFHRGEPYRSELLAETERNLRELGYLNNIRVSATDTTDAGRVNILVSARDSWSLQANANYARAAGGETRWSLQLSDNNFLGHGFTLGAGLGSDEDSGYWNAWFRQRRLTDLHLVVGFDCSQRDDGHFRNIFISKPFYAQDDRWSLEAKAWDGRTDRRYYLSNAGPVGQDPLRAASLYAKLPTHEKGLRLRLQRLVSTPGKGRVWRLGLGLRITELTVDPASRPAWLLSDGRYADLQYLDDPGQPLARELGTVVYPHLWLRSQGRDWTKARFVRQYGPVEDIPLDTMLDLKAGPVNPFREAESGAAAWLVELAASRWWRLGGWLAKLEGWGYGQSAGGGHDAYHLHGLSTGWIKSSGPENEPWITRVFAEYAGGRNVLDSDALVLGLDRGLRTLEFDGMAGDRLVRWNVEQGKVTPWELLGMFRVGGAVFYSGGGAWFGDEDRSRARRATRWAWACASGRPGPPRPTSAVWT